MNPAPQNRKRQPAAGRLSAQKALIAWSPARGPQRSEATRGRVKIGPLLEEGDEDWTAPYVCTGGAAWTAQRTRTGPALIARLFIDFHTLVVLDGIDPLVAHNAFLAIDEYRAVISPGCPEGDRV
jgi:hypothetical protein